MNNGQYDTSHGLWPLGLLYIRLSLLCVWSCFTLFSCFCSTSLATFLPGKVHKFDDLYLCSSFRRFFSLGDRSKNLWYMGVFPCALTCLSLRWYNFKVLRLACLIIAEIWYYVFHLRLLNMMVIMYSLSRLQTLSKYSLVEGWDSWASVC